MESLSIECQRTVVEDKGEEDELKSHITCPNCSTNFTVDSMGDDETGEQGKTIKKRRAAAPKKVKEEKAKVSIEPVDRSFFRLGRF